MLNREDAITLLRRGTGGVREWNELRQTTWTCPALDGADLSGVNLHRAQLSGVDLRGARLDECNLRHSNLIRADLSGASLMLADLSGSDARSAKLEGAKLQQARFQEADLSGAGLTRATMLDSVLDGTIVEGTDFTDTRFLRTVVACDISAAAGLEVVQHLGPSILDLRTLLSCENDLPDAFLVGCGIEERDIAYFRDRLGVRAPYHSCFISYSHADRSFAQRLYGSLSARGVRAWVDSHELLPGDDFYHQISIAIRAWDKLLLCCSRTSLRSWWVDNEIDEAFEKERQQMRERGKKQHVLIPLNLDGYMFDPAWTSGKQRAVRSRLAADFTGWEEDNSRFQSELEKVLAALRTDSQARRAPSVHRPASTTLRRAA